MKPAEAQIIQKESSFKTTAKNPHSTAFGLGQLLVGNRKLYANKLGYSPDTTDPHEQLEMFRHYIADRYGSAEEALNFHLAMGYY